MVIVGSQRAFAWAKVATAPRETLSWANCTSIGRLPESSSAWGRLIGRTCNCGSGAGFASGTPSALTPLPGADSTAIDPDCAKHADTIQTGENNARSTADLSHFKLHQEKRRKANVGPRRPSGFKLKDDLEASEQAVLALQVVVGALPSATA